MGLDLLVFGLAILLVTMFLPRRIGDIEESAVWLCGR